MEVGEGEAAPWGAQDREPRDAIHGMKEGVGEGEEVEKLLALGEVFDFDSAEGDFFVAEERDELREMMAGADENGDAIFGAGGAGLLDEGELAFKNP